MTFRNVADQAYWYNSTSLSNSESGVLSIISSIGGSSATSMPSLLTSTSASTSSGALPTGVADSPSGTPVKYLIATILNVNSSGGSQVGTTQGGTSSSSGSGSANTGLAMIILYAITGCVTLLFLVVIMSGAIRAMRHPERYGPRARNRHLPGDSGQSRAGGLTKAILDTFPVVKFLSGNGTSSGATGEGGADGDLERRLQNAQAGIAKDEEAQLETVDINSGETPGGHVAMYEIRSKAAPGSGGAVESEGIAPAANSMSGIGQTSGDRGAGSPHMGGRTEDGADSFVLGDEEEDATKDGHEPAAPTTAASGVAAVDTTNPADVNDSITCPICLLDFEDGDDIRILPCDSRHRFHDAVSHLCSFYAVFLLTMLSFAVCRSMASKCFVSLSFMPVRLSERPDSCNWHYRYRCSDCSKWGRSRTSARLVQYPISISTQKLASRSVWARQCTNKHTHVSVFTGAYKFDHWPCRCL